MCERCKAFEDENGKLTEEVSGLIITVRKQGREIGKLRGDLTKMREDSVDAKLVTRTLDCWKKRLGKANAQTGLTGKRADRVRWAIRLGYGVPELDAMLAGLRVYPFVVFGVRKASGSADARKDDILDALKDEKSIETLIALGRRDVHRGDQMDLNGDQP